MTRGPVWIVIWTICALSLYSARLVAASTPSLPLYQTPLTIAIPAHPQILFALGNSQSTDGSLAGAILTGAGQLSSSLGGALNASSSPVCASIPTGFTPPASATGTGGCAAGSAPITVVQSGNLVDNSYSRLNLAKAGITSILQTYLPVADFALADYSTSSNGVYTTWVYYMSASGGFSFTNSTTPPSGTELVSNPCYGYLSLSTSNTVYSDCAALASKLYKTASISTQNYMVVANSSDDSSINDVLYAGSGGIDPVCVTYGTISPSSPYSYSLSQYESGSVLETYGSEVNNCAQQTSPTNAGFVPYSPQVMYAERGFGYYSSESATTANVLVKMTTAVVNPGSNSQSPTSASTATALSAFTQYLQPETNSTATTEIKATAVQSPLAGLLAGSLSYYKNSNPSSSNGCTPTRYVVLVTDGLPTLDLAGNSWPPLGSAAAVGYGVTATYNSDGSLNSTNDQALTDTINNLKSLAAAGIKTYVVGIGQGADPSIYPVAAAALTAMAIAGGTATGSTGYFPATSAQALTSDLQAILTQIIGTTQSVGASAVNSTGLNQNSFLYQSSFTTQDTFQDWTGDLKAYALNSSGASATTATWSAQTNLDSQTASNRLIATWQPATSSAIPFEWLSGNTASSSTTGITPSSALGLLLTNNSINPVAADSTDTTQGLDRLNYLRGDSSKEQRNGGNYRNRSHKLGDIVDSAPIYVGAPSGPYSGTTVSGGQTYAAFESSQSSRPPYIYVGGNDGAMHAFNALTGSELFAYIPNGIFANLPMLTSPYYNAQHHFFVDGSPAAGDVQFSSGAWHTVLVAGENAGGTSIFALDVTSPSSITSESALAGTVLWEFTDANLGNTYSTPIITLTNDTSAPFLVFFGNGYNSSTGQPYLYAVNPQTGALITKINLCAQVSNVCNALAANGLSGVTAVNTSGVVGAAANLLYAGDLQGNLWRIDISNSNPSNWTVTVLFQATDSSGNSQPITVTPVVSLNPSFPRVAGTLVLFGTGELLTVGDLSSSQVQTLYGVLDPFTLKTYARSNLTGQTLSVSSTTATTGQAFITVSNTSVNLSTSDGWYADLSGLGTGMRDITNPRLESGGVDIVTTFQPSANQCTGGGNGDFLALNYATGGSFAVPVFAIPGSTSPGSTKLSSGNAVGLQFKGDYLSSATIQMTPGGSYKYITSTQLSNSLISNIPIYDPAIGQRRRAWWELQ